MTIEGEAAEDNNESKEMDEDELLQQALLMSLQQQDAAPGAAPDAAPTATAAASTIAVPDEPEQAVEAMVEEAAQESGVDVAATAPTSGADDERKQRLAALAAARKGSPG